MGRGVSEGDKIGVDMGTCFSDVTLGSCLGQCAKTISRWINRILYL